ncbi:tRNA 2-thiouridine(34) synthase MnmA [Candidatus Dependentiae bacterium]|nr:tRNA 2-thiouridine(34) synthase MnmA [Candidatus Dependentiae bacterium]
MKVAVLVSGGVDSSVALALAKQQGHDVTAFYLKIWLEDELSSLAECPWEEDLKYVRAVCAQLEVPLEIISLQQEYWEHVVSYTIAQVKVGRTPNPDVFCNQKVKFGFFLQKIDASYEKIATGHYAQIHQDGPHYILKKTPDPIKDQTYFLAYLRQDQLARCMFPIGHLNKTQVREYAHALNLPNKDRKDSQGICFLGKFKFREFVYHYLGEKVGALVEWETHKKVGEHSGFWFYTIGQRQGIGLAGGPWYVVSKDPEHNIVYISRDYYADGNMRNTFELQEMNWFTGKAPDSLQNLTVKLRHGAHQYPCTVQEFMDDRQKSRVRVTLAENDQGIAPGQFAVFYQGSYCLGSGIISERDSR